MKLAVYVCLPPSPLWGKKHLVVKLEHHVAAILSYAHTHFSP